MIEVEGPDGTVIEFPEGTSNDVITRVMSQHFPAPEKGLREKAAEGLRDFADSNVFPDGIAESALDGLTKGVAATIEDPLGAAKTVGRTLITDPLKNIASIPHNIAMSAGHAGLALEDKVAGDDKSAAISAKLATGHLTDAAVGGLEAVTLGRGGAPVKAASKPAQAAAPVSQADEIIKAGEQAGIDVLTSDVRQPKTFAAKWIQSVGDKIPIAGTGPVRAKQHQQRIDAVQNVVDDYSASVGSQDITDAVMRDVIKTRSNKLTHFSSMKKDVIENIQGAVPVERAKAAINREIEVLEGLKTTEFTPVINRLKDWHQAIDGQDLKSIELLRKQLGEAFKSPELASVRGTGERSLSSIYGALRADMGDHIKRQAGDNAHNRWKTANKELSAMAGELDKSVLKSALKTGEATPEAVRKLLFSQKTSDVKALYKGLSPDGRRNARTAIIQEIVKKTANADGFISPEKFVSQVKRQGRSIGVFFKAEEYQRMKGLTEVLNATRQAGQAALNPPTGVRNVPIIGAAVLTDLMGGAGAGLTSGASLGGAARLYEGKYVRDRLVRLGNTETEAQKAQIVKDIGRYINSNKDKFLTVGAIEQSDNTLRPAANSNQNQVAAAQ